MSFSVPGIQKSLAITNYVLSLHFEQEPDTKTKRTELRKQVEEWLTSVSIPVSKREKKLFNSGGYVVELIASNRPEYGEGIVRIIKTGGPIGFFGTSVR